MSNSRTPAPRGGAPRGPRPPVQKGLFGRIIKALFKAYPGYATLTVICTLLSAFVTAIPATFQQRVLDILVKSLGDGLTWDTAKTQILPLVFILIGLYVISLILMTVQS